MGLDINGVRFLLYSKKMGADFEKSVMIGRQTLDLTKQELSHNLRAFGYPATNQAVNNIYEENGYAELLFKYLGAQSIHSIDYSNYEGATHLYDLNNDIPDGEMEGYTAVIDGGSLEHIFNFPAAIKNCMKMLKVGGCYLGITPANNFLGHGFYQFSPELYFSIFTKQNGFELVHLIAFEDIPAPTWYSVKKPIEIKERISVVNNQPIYLLILARKIEKVSIFATTPQQSDYLATWEDQLDHANYPALPIQRRLLNWAKRNLPAFVKHILKGIKEGHGFNPRFFTPMDPFEDT